ncbi:hypothetical protein JCM21714_4573 [Gracilibacillus boraciitolerans JCM 21714]|uniref:Uncharacterized protein n=1 Tax=Gracilibacillus boraciitolerans JCM 21714 TaxID=1298598 RepID=W4VQ53_9BACI|nr:hypothetical protein [Gracilibacillus boraciitolerans]GAE95347.1 hypothetical protein JCM21714_4573 [Gracilibacillus boraciitolerans JCM 21714]
MQQIITNLWEIIKQTDSMIQAEEQIQAYMESVLCECVGTLMEQMDQVIKEDKQQ